MFAPHRHLFSLWAGLQMLLTVLSGVPRLECACRETANGFLPSQNVRSNSCCCGQSLFWGILGRTANGEPRRIAPCCRHLQAISKDKILEGVCATHSSSCHRKIVPPDAAVQKNPQPANLDGTNPWFALVFQATLVRWPVEADLRSTPVSPEPSDLPIGGLHQVLRI